MLRPITGDEMGPILREVLDSDDSRETKLALLNLMVDDLDPDEAAGIVDGRIQWTSDEDGLTLLTN